MCKYRTFSNLCAFTIQMILVSPVVLGGSLGLVEPANWKQGAVFNPMRIAGESTLPERFSWLDLGACTPVKDQGSAGSCWAFATVGPLESNILIKDGRETNLSEQWLISCNQSGYSAAWGGGLPTNIIIIRQGIVEGSEQY